MLCNVVACAALQQQLRAALHGCEHSEQ